MNTLSKGRVPVADDISRREAAGASVSAGRRLDDKMACEAAGASRPLAVGFRGWRGQGPRTSWGVSRVMHLPGYRRIGGSPPSEGGVQQFEFGGEAKIRVIS